MPETGSKPRTIRTIIGFDFGLRRVGVALGITATGTASPLTTISYQTPDTLWREIDNLITEWQPQHLLVGMPNLHSGQKHTLEKPIRQFAQSLKKRFYLETEFIDESFSSRDAETRLKQMRQAGRHKRIDKTEIDKQAAALLVEQWLEQNASA